MHTADPALPFQFCILAVLSKFYGLIFQWDSTLKDQIFIIAWVFQARQPVKTIMTLQEIMVQLVTKARAHLRTLAGCDFTYMHLPLKLHDLDALLQTNEHLQFAFNSYTGQILIHYPKHKLFNSIFHLIPKISKKQNSSESSYCFYQWFRRIPQVSHDLERPRQAGVGV